jgi:sec-independent protein translocase protein TatA
MLGGLGWQELVIVLIIVIIIFGAGRLPEIGGAVGKSIKEFRAQSADEDERPEEIASKSTTTTTGTTVNQSTVNDAPKGPREVRADEI